MNESLHARGQKRNRALQPKRALLGRFAHKADAHEYDFAVLRRYLRIAHSALLIDMCHIEFHFYFSFAIFFWVSPLLARI